MADRLTVDELARTSGLNTSTIRLYRHRGLLHAPAMEGRVGYFDDTHVARLALIGDLRKRGFSLAAIKDVVDSWESGRDLDAVLGLERVLVNRPERQTISAAELAERVPGLGEAKQQRRLIGLGLATRRADGDFDVYSGFLPVAALLASLGIPLDVMLDEYERVDAFAHETAQRFVAVFEERILATVDTIDPVALAPMIAALREAGVGVVAGAVGVAIDDAAADAVARHADGIAAVRSVN